MKGFKTTAGVTVEAAAGTDEMSNSRPPGQGSAPRLSGQFFVQAAASAVRNGGV